MTLISLYKESLSQFLLSPEPYVYTAALLAAGRFFLARERERLISLGLKQDFIYGVMNQFVLWPVMLGYAALYKTLFDAYLPFTRWGLASGWHPVALGIVSFLLVDFLQWFFHFLRHHVMLLWHFHTIHHSQEDLNPLTTHRTHIVENLFKDPLAFIPLALVGASLPQWFLFKLFNHSWGYVIHSNLRINLGPLRYIIVSPQNHRIHHSAERRHWNKNFGERLVFWDWFFGTLYMNTEEYPATGTPERPFPVERTAGGWALVTNFARQFVYPFRMIFGSGSRQAQPAVVGLEKSAVSERAGK